MQNVRIGNFEFTVSNTAELDKSQLTTLYWNYHPRFRFFKMAPLDSKLLDVGAGSGGLWHWKQWGEPARNDIEMYAVDLKKGELFDKYQDYQICNLDKNDLKYDNNYFDSVLMAHVLEHIQDENKILAEVERVLKVDGRLYIEIPSIETLHYPSKDLFLHKGIDVSTVNFFDDCTHIRTFALDTLSETLKSHKFKVLESGIIENKYLESIILSCGIKNSNQELSTYGVWLQLKWAQYIVCKK